MTAREERHGRDLEKTEPRMLIRHFPLYSEARGFLRVMDGVS